MRILIVRPQPGAAATAALVAALGHVPLVHPLLATATVDWALPATPPDAVILTSAAAVRLAGPQAEQLHHLPALCVGAATAAAARAAGWAQVTAGPGAVQALIDGAAGGPHRHLLHLAGEDRTETRVPPGLTLAAIIVYRAVLQPLPLLPDAGAVLLHSPRTARHFAAEWDRSGGHRADIAVHAISAATLAAAGPGWRAIITAAQPDDDALLATLPKAG
jgi:uroporphyrinogen-III synthase